MSALSLAEAIVQLSADRPELGLVTDGADDALRPVAEVASGPLLDRWLADTATLSPGMDDKTAAAYLLSIFVWRLGQIIGALYLDRVALPVFGALDLLADMETQGEGRSRDIRFRYALKQGGPGNATDRDKLAASIVSIHQPLVNALHFRTRLSKRALWRLTTDGMAEGLLDHGRHTGGEERAMTEATAILAAPPLHNPQWRFVEIDVEGKRRRWFRLRGGCCRLYLTPGADYCTTCVVRPHGEQVARLTAFVERRPS